MPIADISGRRRARMLCASLASLILVLPATAQRITALPDQTSTIRLSNHDINHVICQGGDVEDVKFSSEKAISVERGGSDAWIKFLVKEVSSDGDPGPVRRGDLVSFQLSNPVAGPKPVSVTKYALCLPGDRLTVVQRPESSGRTSDGYFYCNGRLLGVSKPFGRAGQRLEQFRPAVPVIPAGEAYVGSSHPDGFDSRYYGLVELARLTRMERVL